MTNRAAIAAKSVFAPMPARSVKQYSSVGPSVMTIAEFNAACQPTTTRGITALSAIDKQHLINKLAEGNSSTAEKAASLNAKKAKGVKTETVQAPYVPKPRPTVEQSRLFMSMMIKLDTTYATYAKSYYPTARDERIAAIKEFVGYDPTAEFGSQELSARMLANGIITGRIVAGISPADKRSAERSMTGFVFGTPDNARKHILDLLAKETLLIDNICEAEWQSNEPTRSEAERTSFSRLAEQYRTDLAQVRATLELLDF